MTVNQMMINLKKLDVKAAIRASLQEMTPLMADLNRKQMERGEDNQGRPITYEGRTQYSPRTAERKGFSSPINLRDTGDFHRGIYAEVQTDDIWLDSRDNKTALLVEKTSGTTVGLLGEDKIFGLNEYSLPIVRENGQEKLIKKVKEKLQL